MSEKSQTFFSTLETMNSGRTLTSLEKKLQELLDAVVETERGGELVVKLKVKPWKKGMYKTTAAITAKMPEDAPEEAIFFVDSENRLVRDDPRQTEMFKDDKTIPLHREDIPERRENNA